MDTSTPRPLRPRARTTLAGAATALVVGVTATACSSAEEPDVASTPSATAPSSSAASASASASATPDAEPAAETTTAQDEVEPPEEPTGLKNRPKDRAEFSRYVVDTWIYGFVSNDPAPLVDASVQGGCDGCGQFRKELTNRAEEEYFVELLGVGVGRTSEPKKQPPGNRVTITETQLALPESRILATDGTLEGLSPAHPDTTFTAKLKWLPPQQTRAKGKKNKSTPGELRLVSFGVETNDG
ncbi:hypothetical protein KLP28_00900 [Nocardioidaceae bacterium]|nr:hypothetical protein KLP28_00900 [Nocardioidaceae bacterium]